MVAPQSIVRVHQYDQTLTFQVEGRATMHQSLLIRRFAEQCLAGRTTVLGVDLRHCTHMDSTFLGTLVFLRRAVNQQGQGEFTLISPSPECCRLLQQMGLEKIFPIVAVEELAASTWTELKSELEDTKVFKRNVVQAHQELAHLEGPAGEIFRELADSLARELESEKPESWQDKNRQSSRT
ncbi:MAG TPA: STAS domain-containing protein [Candidatus Binatia bacterium]|nr:STAS domain-containing protein [Candidatus Binatia bacterium]